jgi:uncharacterized membrane protein YphA (DoxX/SURF4 family)
MDTPQPTVRRPWVRIVVGTVAAFVVGAVLLFSVYGKSLDPEGFAQHLDQQDLAVFGVDLTFGQDPLHLAWATLAVEALLGVLLVLGVRRLWVLVPTLLLVLFFVGVTAHEWYRAAHGWSDPLAGCGCFGKVVTRTPQEAFFQDLGLLLLPAVLAFLGRPRGAPRVPRRRTWAAVVVALLVVGFAIKAPEIGALDDWATQLSPGVHVTGICVGGDEQRKCLGEKGQDAAALATGHHLVVLSSLKGDAFDERSDDLSAYADAWYEKAEALAARGGGTPAEPEPWVLTDLELDGREWTNGRAAAGRTAPTFTILSLPPALFTLLHRRLPRAFEVRDGVVVATWPGFPPLPPIAPLPTDGE